MKLSSEIKEKAQKCTTSEEILALARENNIDITAEDAAAFLEGLKKGELSEEELDNVAGGEDGCGKPRSCHELVRFNSKEEIKFIFNVGDHIEAYCDAEPTGEATPCVVRELKRLNYPHTGWVDAYFLEKVPGSPTLFVKGNYLRNQIKK